MKGYFRKRGNKWSFTVDMGKNEEGKRKQKTLSGFKTKKEAEQAANELINELNKGTFIEPTKQKVGEYFEQWLNKKKKNLKRTTYNNYKVLVYNHIIKSIGNHDLRNLRADHLQTFFDELNNKNLSDEVIKKIYILINNALKQAKTWKLITDNVAELIDPPKVRRKEMKIWNEEQVKTFLSLDFVKDDPLYIVFVLALNTGMRRGEILGLKWSDIDFERRIIKVSRTLSNDGKELQEPKTASGLRSIDFAEMTYRELKKHFSKSNGEANNETPVISTSLETFVSPRNLSRTWYRLLEKSQLTKIRFHDLRHTHATILLSNGEPIKAVAERLGHSAKVLMETYAHVIPGMQSKMAQKFEDLYE